MSTATFDFRESVDLDAPRVGLSIPERFVLARADFMVARGRVVEVKRWTGVEGDLLTAYSPAPAGGHAISVSAIKAHDGWEFARAVRLGFDEEASGYAAAQALVERHA